MTDKKQKRVAILGATGELGRSIPPALVGLYGGEANIKEIILVGRNLQKVIAVGQDCESGLREAGSNVKIRMADYKKNPGAFDTIIITASIELPADAKGAKIRDYLFKGNIALIDDVLIPYLKNYIKNNGSEIPNIVFATNPVYPLVTYLYYRLREEGLPFQPTNLCGVGSRVDSDRLAYITAEVLAVPRNAVSGEMVLGDHGKSMVPIISNLCLNDKPLKEYCDYLIKCGLPINGFGRASGMSFEDYYDLAKYLSEQVRNEGPRIVGLTGRTVSGIQCAGKSLNGPVGDICATVADMLTDGKFSIERRQKKRRILGVWSAEDGVYVGLPGSVTSRGVKPNPDNGQMFKTMHEYERRKFDYSVGSIRSQVMKIFDNVGKDIPQEFRQLSAGWANASK